MAKSTVDEIRQRFDQDVERFSNLETGQSTTLDAAQNLEMITEGIFRLHPQVADVLDIGCGAGNFMMKLLQKKSPLNIHLVDLSQPMLDRAQERILSYSPASMVRASQTDIRDLILPEQSFDAVVAAAVLHHLRSDQEWKAVFENVYQSLRPGGSFWIFDLVTHENPAIQQYLFNDLYGAFLSNFRDANYRDHVFEYIEKEDSPRSTGFQLSLLAQVGFRTVEVLHKNLCFASFYGIK
jgi:tRNA (cmo5U34)-methyltransferase